jgi:ABC-type antimicrobial peptide transport system permease subunit
MQSTSPILLPWEILITLALLSIFALFFSQIIGINYVQDFLRQSTAREKMIIWLLGVILGGCSFIINTGFISKTSTYNPPHGIEFGVWDVNPELEQFGGDAFVYGDDYLALDSDKASLKFISNERFQRYLRPPFLRKKCYTENKVGCTWADIDIANFGEVLQWLDYLIQIAIALLSGFLGSEIMLWQMKKKNLFQKQEAG